MNILFEIADKDLLFIILAFVGILLFGTIIFFTISKKNNKENSQDYHLEENPSKLVTNFESSQQKESTELFSDIHPETKEQAEAKNELERVFNQMAKDLEKGSPSKEDIEEFEREQEENAIISYQELIKQAEMKRLQQEHMQKPETNAFEEEIMPKQSNIFEEMKSLEADKISESKPIKYDEEPKKFRNSEIISPIFGIQKPGQYNRQKSGVSKHSREELNINYDDNDDDFLNSLKEFRNNL